MKSLFLGKCQNITGFDTAKYKFDNSPVSINLVAKATEYDLKKLYKFKY